MRTEIDALTGLRGIASICVLLYHASTLLNSSDERILIAARGAFGGGYLGVDLFFVLSGFVLAYTYADQALHSSPIAYAKFLWKRLARIYPIHLAALGLLLVSMLVHKSLSIAYSTDHSLGSLLETLTLVHAWSIPVHGMWNVPSWSISAEWAAYLAFPLIAAIAMQLRSRLAILFCVGSLMGALALLVAQNAGSSTLYFGMHRIAAEFSSGVLLHRLWSLSRHDPRISDILARASLLVMLLLSGSFEHFVRRGVSLEVFPVLACAVIYFLPSASGRCSNVLSSPVMVYLGRISYSLYMVHFSFLILAKNYAEQAFATLPTSVGFGLVIVFVFLSFACAHGFYRWIEEPARRKMLSLIERERRPHTSALTKVHD